ncbi:hypothetical protein, conserved [Eimeria acervulina]|uniref:Uncharacterized protein n=1 Tax=Eimeria acervulina TaxID=5801 RepID=U6G9R6_EIMAC|nr:hypothetical protein, conserved [Eimeria acervulina]CDI76880.1 hypothetical protein, conserved [Eimeria acervulina]
MVENSASSFFQHSVEPPSLMNGGRDGLVDLTRVLIQDQKGLKSFHLQRIKKLQALRSRLKSLHLQRIKELQPLRSRLKSLHLQRIKELQALRGRILHLRHHLGCHMISLAFRLWTKLQVNFGCPFLPLSYFDAGAAAAIFNAPFPASSVKVFLEASGGPRGWPTAQSRWELGQRLEDTVLAVVEGLQGPSSPSHAANVVTVKARFPDDSAASIILTVVGEKTGEGDEEVEHFV